MGSIHHAEKLMEGFAGDTGLTDGGKPPRRYLWTDAFAVCNFLALHHRSGQDRWRETALRLVDQVHRVLGRHRGDDPRSGWISGLSEEQGRKHPTRGGLRIGKPLNERGPAEPFDPAAEWDRDGQYYHYLTKWMHALDQVSLATGEIKFNLWARDLARAAHRGFFYEASPGVKRMHWKMSIDLSYPLVPSMGHHDPLDGYVTCLRLQATAARFPENLDPDLEAQTVELERLCAGRNWTTEDPLGIGGLLFDACRLAQLVSDGRLGGAGVLEDLLRDALSGLISLAGQPLLKLPPDHRLAFRELGLSIGLQAVERIAALVRKHTGKFDAVSPVHSLLKRFRPHFQLGESIAGYWLEPGNRQTPGWRRHRDINRVMLATSLVPDGFLEPAPPA